MTPFTYVIPPLAQMPIRGHKNAPETFRGNYKHVAKFIEHYNRLHVISEKDKCHGILEYCHQNVKDFIQINPHYLSPNWKTLQEEILNAYDADHMNSRIRPKDFFNYVRNHGQGQITNLSQWKKYHRDYIAKAGFLKQNKQSTMDITGTAFLNSSKESLKSDYKQGTLPSITPNHDRSH